MKYPIVLKYNYSYISSGNYYKEAVREYYQLFTDSKNFETFAFGFTPTDILLTVKEVSENEISCEHTFSIYSKSYTFSHDRETITNSFVLKKGEAIESKCYDIYWRYASGGENGPATLRVEWITYDQFYDECLESVKESNSNAIRFASHLIKTGEYDTAFKILDAADEECYELGLCYEMGYGTEIDLDRALNIYLKQRLNGYADQGIERIVEKLENKKIKLDSVKKTVILERLGQYKAAYSNAKIPRELGDNDPSDLRRNVELSIIWFLTLGRPYNDPMSYIAPPTSHTTRHLAEYYDLVNGVPENERKVYYKRWEERDEYEGGTNTKERFYEENIIKTLRAEAEKGDVIAQAVLAVQEHKYISDHAHFADLLYEKAEKRDAAQSAMAYYFLGLYHREIAKNAEDTYKYDYRTNYDEQSRICKEHSEKSIACFKAALDLGFHLAAAPIAKVIAEEEPTRAYEILKGHEPYIPSIGNSFTDDYYKLLKSLEENV